MIKLELHPDYEYLRKEMIKMVNSFNHDGENVFNGSRNRIKKFKINEQWINVKSFKSPNFFNSVVYKFFRKSKAQRSFLYALRLNKKQINTPFPIGYYEKTHVTGLKASYYISIHLDYEFDFRALIHNPIYPDRKEILKQFTAFCFKLHENNVNFLDHSPGNTLIVKATSKRYMFYLIDLNRMRFESMNFSKRMRNFRRLWLSKKMIQIMSNTYAELMNTSEKAVFYQMTKYSKGFQRKVNSKKIRKRKWGSFFYFLKSSHL